MYLDELSGTYAEKEFDNLIFQITTKDEDKLNEMYHQAEYLLKPKGTLLFISRRGWDAAISSKFTLVAKEELERGGHIYKILLLKKKVSGRHFYDQYFYIVNLFDSSMVRGEELKARIKDHFSFEKEELSVLIRQFSHRVYVFI